MDSDLEPGTRVPAGPATTPWPEQLGHWGPGQALHSSQGQRTERPRGGCRGPRCPPSAGCAAWLTGRPPLPSSACGRGSFPGQSLRGRPWAMRTMMRPLPEPIACSQEQGCGCSASWGPGQSGSSGRAAVVTPAAAARATLHLQVEGQGPRAPECARIPLHTQHRAPTAPTPGLPTRDSQPQPPPAAGRHLPTRAQVRRWPRGLVSEQWAQAEPRLQGQQEGGQRPLWP